MRYGLILISLLASVFISGCSNNLLVSGDFPSPLIDSDPHTLGVFYDEEFLNYTYQEKSEERSKWTIEQGAAQRQLFNTILSKLFHTSVELPQWPLAGESDLDPAVDLVLQPKVSAFQYSTPRETKFKIYEVWIKYNLSAFDREGQLVADWLVTAYGKTPTAFMKSDEDAMNAAIVVALRDLGANLSLGTLRVPELRAWLENNPAQAQIMASNTH
jgi:hypothetical protein